MWKDIKRAYAQAGKFMIALPLIASLPVGIEAIQHLVEWRIGMFDNLAMAAAVEEHPQRMAFGYAKTFILFLIPFWVLRFMAHQGDIRRVLRLDMTAMALFALVVGFDLCAMLMQNQVGTWMSAMVANRRTLLLVGLLTMLAVMMLEIYLVAWKAGAALGNSRLHPLASIRLMRGHILWGFGLTMAAFVPTIIIHYLLNGLAIGSSTAVTALLLGLDSLLVGYLAALYPAAAYIIAERAASAAGLRLAGREREIGLAV